MTGETDTTVRFPATRLALAMAVSGTVGAFATEAAVDPVTIVFWRCVFGAATLGAWCLLRDLLPDPNLSRSRLVFAALSGFCMVLGWITFFSGLSITSIATATIIFHVHPFFLILMGILFLRERITLDQVVWMASAFIGVGLASGVMVSSEFTGSQWILGAGLTLTSALLYAVATLLAKRLGGQRPEITALCQTITGIVMLAPFFQAFEPVPMASWGWLIGIGVIHTGIAYVVMYSAYPTLTTPAIGVLTFIYPLVAIIVDWAAYDHPFGWVRAVGMGLIAAGTLGVRLDWRLSSYRAKVNPGQ